MRTIVIDVQLAPCDEGIDIFKASDKLIKLGSCYRNEDGAKDTAMCFSEFPGLKEIKKPILAQLVIKLFRENGFYKVKFNGKWEIARWSDNSWYRAGSGLRYNDSETEDIVEDVIERTEA